LFCSPYGKGCKILPTTKSYKRIGEGDTGLNTGGMGAVSPVPYVDAVLMDKIETRIVNLQLKTARWNSLQRLL
jgi:phosphoribosylamine-glycine ligase